MASIIEPELDLVDADTKKNQDSIKYAILFSINWISFGYALSYSSNSQFVYVKDGVLTPEEAGLFGSMLAVGALLGSLFSGLFLKKYIGYKFSVLVSCKISALGWFMHVLALTINRNNTIGACFILLTARFLVGFCCGISSNCVPVYVANLASTKYRHLIGVFPPLAMNLGYLLSFLFGHILITSDIKASSPIIPESSLGNSIIYKNMMSYSPIIGMILCLIGVISTIFVPDMNEEDNWSDGLIDISYNPLPDHDSSIFETIRGKLAFLRQPYICYELFVGILIMILQQFIGINVIIFNATSIFSLFFKNSKSSPSTPSLVCVFIGLVYFISTFTTICVSKFLKRKTILFVSSLTITLFHMTLAIIYYKNFTDNILGPLVAILFVLVFCCSWGPFPWLIISEIYEPSIKNFGLTASTSVSWISMFLITAIYAPLQETIGLHGIFFVLSGISLSSLIFVVYLLPETKNKSLEEIQHIFREM